MDVVIEPWKKLIIHEIIEYRLEDWVERIAFNSRTSGGGIPTVQWTEGVAMAPIPLPNTESVVQEEMNGVLHWSSVSFAIKEKFENQIVRDNVTINLVDVSPNEVLNRVALKLKSMSKYS
jgi:hypothetical protein